MALFDQGVSKDGAVEEATLVAFEHALDKFSMPLSQCRRIHNLVCGASFLKFIRPFTVQESRVWNEYWKENWDA